jgi:hypothetical protein
VGRARLQFGFATEAELEAMDAERVSIHRRGQILNCCGACWG